MKNKTGIWILTILLLAVSGYFLARTWKVNSIRKEAEVLATDKKGNLDYKKKQQHLDSLWKQEVFLGSTLESLTKQELGLGLDLQGGMHVILEVSPVEIVRTLAGGSRDTRVTTAIKNAQEIAKTSNTNFVDIFVSEFRKIAPDTKLASVFSNSTNRERITFSSSDSEVTNYVKAEVDGAFERSFRVIRARVDKFGVANPNLQRLTGSNRIQVELPGVDNPDRVRKLLSGAAKLEFCEVYNLQEVAPAIDGLSATLLQLDAEKAAATKTTATTDSTKKSGLAAQLATKDAKDTSSLAKASTFSSMFIPNGNGFAIRTKDTSRVNQILRRPDVASLFPPDLSWVYAYKPTTSTTNEEIIDMIAVKNVGRAPLEGDVITDAKQDYGQTGKAEVNMKMNAEGARKWRALTAANINRQVAIILDGLQYSAPVVQSEIPNGSSVINGSFTVEEAQDLANVLKAGKLPAPTNIVEDAVVGASVGSEAVNAGVISALVGLIVVLIFMLIYYNQAGFIADLALFVNLFLLMGVMASLGATLTLPGIAGIVLTIGMSVDANVLIYERIKEELAAGKGFAQAVRDGFANAMSSIIDSNVTTFITGAVLAVFGTGLILGFATTLIIGILTSLFAAIFISRLIFEYYISKGKTVKFSSSFSEKLFKGADFDFVSKRRTYYLISGTIIALGVASILWKGFGLGVDFKGGRTYVARFQENVNTDDVREAVKAAFGGEAAEVKTFGGFNQVKITSAYKIDNTAPELENSLKAELDKALSNVKGNKGTVGSSSRVSPTIANDTIKGAIWAILLSILLVFIYIYIRFKKLAFGYGALVALFHDVLIILGIFSIFRGFLPFSLDIDQAFIGAVLTIMGYSMNDTVVVFDRVREYLADNKGKKESIPTIINNALNSTLSRTAITGLSTLMVLIVLFIFGGETIRGFVFAMGIGVIVGTYSSLFVATPIVVDSLQREQEQEAAKLVAVPVEAKKK